MCVSRLAELRTAAGIAEQRPSPARYAREYAQKSKGKGKGKGKGRHSLADAPIENPAILHLMTEEANMRGVCKEIARRVEAIRKHSAEWQKMFLPTKRQQIEDVLATEEAACDRWLKLSKDILERLRGGGGASASEMEVALDDSDELTEDDFVQAMAEEAFHESLKRLQKNMADYWKHQLKRLVTEFLVARSSHRMSIIESTKRRLQLAYPEAGKETIAEAVSVPKIGDGLLQQRLDRGETILGESLNSSEESRALRIEEESRELKVMFLQFAELVDQQGELLSAIEGNIDSTLRNTDEALAELREARRLQAKIWRDQLRQKIMCCFFATILAMFLLSAAGVDVIWYLWMLHAHVKHVANQALSVVPGIDAVPSVLPGFEKSGTNIEHITSEVQQSATVLQHHPSPREQRLRWEQRLRSLPQERHVRPPLLAGLAWRGAAHFAGASSGHEVAPLHQRPPTLKAPLLKATGAHISEASLGPTGRASLRVQAGVVGAARAARAKSRAGPASLGGIAARTAAGSATQGAPLKAAASSTKRRPTLARLRNGSAGVSDGGSDGGRVGASMALSA